MCTMGIRKIYVTCLSFAATYTFMGVSPAVVQDNAYEYKKV